MRTIQLRARFLTALVASGAIAATSATACGGAVDGTGSSGTSGTNSSGGQTSGSSGTNSSGDLPPSTSPSTPPKPPVPPPPPSTCADGRKGSYSCYTYDQLVSSYQNRGGRGGDSGDAPDPSLFDANGCLPAKLVEDGCCNAATSGPDFNASNKTCCYLHCDGACCGRPFIVGGENQVADVRERSDWMNTSSGAASSPISGTFETSTTTTAAAALDADVRARITASWARDAAMEHASVASFARFTLELLALGAPADLVLGAQEATRDEIEHALACFAIASRYAGRDLGPGKLDIGTTMPAVDLARSVEAAIVEGCVGETLSALLAEARLARAEDADVRTTLRRIANEEARHAELAWRFVGWAITTGGDEVRAAASRAFEAALVRAPGSFDTSLRGLPADTLRAHGLLDEKAAHEVALRTLHDVVKPCAAALVGGASTTPVRAAS